MMISRFRFVVFTGNIHFSNKIKIFNHKEIKKLVKLIFPKIWNKKC